LLVVVVVVLLLVQVLVRQALVLVPVV